MRITFFGTGYVGLVSGACFSELGNEVLCFDIDKSKIEKLNKGEIPIYEPGLEELVRRNSGQGRLRFSDDVAEAVKFSNVYFIAVGTPPKGYGLADLTYVFDVAKAIGKNLEKDRAVIVTKSTVPVGSNQKVGEIIKGEIEKRSVIYEIATVSNPEFLKEGTAINDFMKPDRVVVGVESDWAKKIMEELYRPLTKNGHPIYYMDIASSEMSKYAANTLLAAKISFINQVSCLCEMTGADIEQVRQAISADQRIGDKFLYPGVGYGGSCFPKDVQALAALAKSFGYSAKLIESIEEVNESQKKLLAEKVLKYFKDVDGKKLAVWGLSFKPNTDDMRSAPSIDIIEKLIAKGAKISAYDPVAIEEAQIIFNHRIDYCENMYDCLKDADALIVVTEWSQFKEPDFEKIKGLLKEPTIFDGRNLYEPLDLGDLGFNYFSIGRGPVIRIKESTEI